MQKDIHHKWEVPITFANIRHKILYRIVFFFIENNLFSNRDEFSIDDKVKYNWKAKVYISTACDNEVHVVKSIRKYRDGSVALKFGGIDGGGDAFWFKKA